MIASLLELFVLVKYWPWFLAGFVIFVIILVRASNRRTRQQAVQQQPAPAPTPAQQPTPAPQPAPAPAVDRYVEPPKYQHGLCLTYQYREVGFYVPDSMIITASHVPAGQQLTLAYVEHPEDPDAIAVLYKGNEIGYLYRGKIRDMVRDYAERDDRDMLLISRKWHDKPALDLYMYQTADDAVAWMRRRPGCVEASLRVHSDAPTPEVGEPVTVEEENDRFVVYSDTYDRLGTVSQDVTGYDCRVAEVDDDRIHIICMPREAEM